MHIYRYIVIAILFFSSVCYGLQADQILIIVNSDCDESVQIAEYYCAKRAVPVSNILALPLGSTDSDEMSRDDYNKLLAEPIKKKLTDPAVLGNIRCLLTTYGVPVKVEGIPPLKDQQDLLPRLQEELKKEKDKIELAKLLGTNATAKQKKDEKIRLVNIQAQIDRIMSKETNASVDSELSMVLFGDYDLYRWQKNRLKLKTPYWDFKSLMVCRLDGPDMKIIKGLIDKSLVAEKNGLKGTAYIDSGYGLDKGKDSTYTKFDEYLIQTAANLRARHNMKVVEERTKELFAPGSCPDTAIYCGWYSLKKYVDAFDFVDGAIGYHIASWEAIDIRDANSSQWCPAMLKDGITATLGPVAEPYLNAFPQPNLFFDELLSGRCLVEAFYRTKPFNSWQLILIGDPLYKPFPKPDIFSAPQLQLVN